MWGVGGLARFYAQKRYLKETVPAVHWVPEATLAVETADSIEGGWALKQAMAYRSFGGQLPLPALHKLLCDTERLRRPSSAGASDLIFALPGTHHFSGKNLSDAVVDRSIGAVATSGCDAGGANGMLGFESVTIDAHVTPSSVVATVMSDRKILCFKKTIGVRSNRFRFVWHSNPA